MARATSMAYSHTHVPEHLYTLLVTSEGSTRVTNNMTADASLPAWSPIKITFYQVYYAAGLVTRHWPVNGTATKPSLSHGDGVRRRSRSAALGVR